MAMTMAETGETFDEAVTRFQGFLADSGYPRKIVWVEPQDVLLTETKRIYVWAPVSPDREKRARQMFEAVIKLNCGLRMATLGEGAEATYCYLWGWPADHEKEPNLWPRQGVSMSVLQTESRRSAEPVRNRLRWIWLSWRLRAKQGRKSLAFT